MVRLIIFVTNIFFSFFIKTRRFVLGFFKVQNVQFEVFMFFFTLAKYKTKNDDFEQLKKTIFVLPLLGVLNFLR